MTSKGNLCPRVSIVTPSFNQGDYLEETIRSVLLQGYPNIEYWVIDGGSNDRSIEILHRYSPWLAGWVSEKDAGQSDAINKGWIRSTGDFLGWINSDDVLLPGAILNCVQFFEDHPEIGFVYGNLEYINEYGEFRRFKTYADFDLIKVIRDCRWISQPGNLFRHSLLAETGLLDPKLHLLMDFDFWIKAGFVTKFGHLQLPLARFREHADAKTSIKTNLAAHEIEIVYDRIFSRDDLSERLRAIKKRALSSSAWYSALTFYSANQLREALSQLINSFRFYPFILLQRRFYLLGAKIIFTSLVGGKQSAISQLVRGLLNQTSKGGLI